MWYEGIGWGQPQFIQRVRDLGYSGMDMFDSRRIVWLYLLLMVGAAGLVILTLDNISGR